MPAVRRVVGSRPMQWTGSCLGAVFGMVALTSAVGCGPSSEFLCPYDPAQSAFREECGVWVSSSLGNDTNPGTRASPVASLKHAIELARYDTKHVYACGDSWEEVVELPAGMSLSGGFECHEHDWAFQSWPAAATLSAGANQIPLTVVGVADEQTVISDFIISSFSATIPGGSSIALFIADADRDPGPPDQVPRRRRRRRAGRGARRGPAPRRGRQPGRGRVQRHARSRGPLARSSVRRRKQRGQRRGRRAHDRDSRGAGLAPSGRPRAG